MQKEEFRDMLLGAIDEKYHHEVYDWLTNAEKQFERIANATNWPIREIRGFYRPIVFEIRLRQKDLSMYKGIRIMKRQHYKNVISPPD